GSVSIEGDTAIVGARFNDGPGSAYIFIFSPAIEVVVDIKPGSDPNSINCLRNRTIAVAILTTSTADGDPFDFDATTVDHTTVEFEGATESHVNKKTGVVKRHEKDVDRDGDTDLVLHFKLFDTNLGCESTEGLLTGQTFGGQAIEGTDSVNMID
ncbi:MAG: FG-GAP repeat protein, partial [Candidatus Dadabacteria bacterium]|nr:FG-GAP repeat protein [Candidatus Dadabacteria bacterium]